MSVELYSLHCLPISRLIIVNLSPIYDHLALRNSWQQQSSSLTHGLCYNSGNAFGADFWGAVCTLMTSRCLFVIYYSVNCISSLRTFSFTAEVSATAEPLHKILSFFFHDYHTLCWAISLLYINFLETFIPVNVPCSFFPKNKLFNRFVLLPKSRGERRFERYG